MWKAPAKKLAVAAGTVGYEVGVSVLSEKVGAAVADETLTQFPNQTLQEYTYTRNQAADKYYNRFSICGSFGAAMKKNFNDKE